MLVGVVLTVVSSWYLVGLSVTVGLVIYPSFDLVGGSRWGAFHRHHVARITWAVGLVWAAQALGLALWWLRAPGTPSSWWWTATGAVAALVVTATSALPRHRRLEHAFDPRVGRALRRAHWVRTEAWVVAAVAATTALGAA